MSVLGTLTVELELKDGDFVMRTRNAEMMIQNLGKAANTSSGDVNKLNSSVSSVVPKLRDIAIVTMTAIHGFQLLNNSIGALPRGIIEANAQLEKMTVLLTGLSRKETAAERVKEAAADVQRLTDVAQKAPFKLQELTASFVKFKSVGLTDADGKLKSLTNAIASFGGDDQALHRATVAIQQMASKGVVSMEELRQQLGESVPAAIDSMAFALGKTTGQLVQDIAQGTVGAKGALDAMLAEFERRFSGSSEKMMHTWTGMVSQLDTKWMLFKKRMGDSGFFEEMKGGLQDIMDYLDSNEAETLGAKIGVVFRDMAVTVKNVIVTLHDMWQEIKNVGAAVIAFTLLIKGIPAAAAIVGSSAAFIGKVGAAWTKAGVEAKGYDTITKVAMKDQMIQGMGMSGQIAQTIAALRAQQAALLTASNQQARNAQMQSNAYKQLERDIIAARAQITGITVQTVESTAALGTFAATVSKVNAAVAAMGGWFGVITMALSLGAAAWAYWGEAGEGALEKVIKAKGELKGVDLAEFNNASDEERKKQQEAYVELLKEEARLKRQNAAAQNIPKSTIGAIVALVKGVSLTKTKEQMLQELEEVQQAMESYQKADRVRKENDAKEETEREVSKAKEKNDKLFQYKSEAYERERALLLKQEEEELKVSTNKQATEKKFSKLKADLMAKYDQDRINAATREKAAYEKALKDYIEMMKQAGKSFSLEDMLKDEFDTKEVPPFIVAMIEAFKDLNKKINDAQEGMNRLKSQEGVSVGNESKDSQNAIKRLNSYAESAKQNEFQSAETANGAKIATSVIGVLAKMEEELSKVDTGSQQAALEARNKIIDSSVAELQNRYNVEAAKFAEKIEHIKIKEANGQAPEKTDITTLQEMDKNLKEELRAINEGLAQRGIDDRVIDNDFSKRKLVVQELNTKAIEENTEAVKASGEQGNGKLAMKLLMDKGWTKNQAAAIAANLGDESGYKTNGKPGDSGTAVGIAQWRGERQDRFKEKYGKSLQEASFEEQIAFVDWELKNSHKSAGDALKTTNDPGKLAALVEQKYEISKLGSQGGVQPSRVRNAKVFSGFSDEEIANADSARPDNSSIKYYKTHEARYVKDESSQRHLTPEDRQAAIGSVQSKVADEAAKKSAKERYEEERKYIRQTLDEAMHSTDSKIKAYNDETEWFVKDMRERAAESGKSSKAEVNHTEEVIRTQRKLRLDIMLGNQLKKDVDKMQRETSIAKIGLIKNERERELAILRMEKEDELKTLKEKYGNREEYHRAVAELEEKYAAKTELAMKKTQGAWGNLGDQVERDGREIYENIGVSMANGIADGLANMAMSGKMSFQELTRSVLAMAGQMIVKLLILKAVMSLVGMAMGSGSVDGTQAGNSFGVLQSDMNPASGPTIGVMAPNINLDPREKGGVVAYANGGAHNATPVSPGTLTKGGVAKKAKLVLFGEGQHPEAFIPMLDRKSIQVTRGKNGELFAQVPSGEKIPVTMKDLMTSNAKAFAVGGTIGKAVGDYKTSVAAMGNVINVSVFPSINVASLGGLAGYGDFATHSESVSNNTSKNSVVINVNVGNVSGQQQNKNDEKEKNAQSSQNSSLENGVWNAIAEKIKVVVQQELVTQSRPGGMMWKSA